MALEREQKTYEQKLPELLTQAGKFALISGDEVAGVFGTYEDAIRAGYEKYGLTPFMVKQIHATERVQYFTRPIVPCHT